MQYNKRKAHGAVLETVPTLGNTVFRCYCSDDRVDHFVKEWMLELREHTRISAVAIVTQDGKGRLIDVACTEADVGATGLITDQYIEICTQKNDDKSIAREANMLYVVDRLTQSGYGEYLTMVDDDDASTLYMRKHADHSAYDVLLDNMTALRDGVPCCDKALRATRARWVAQGADTTAQAICTAVMDTPDEKDAYMLSVRLLAVDPKLMARTSFMHVGDMFAEDTAGARLVLTHAAAVTALESRAFLGAILGCAGLVTAEAEYVSDSQ